ncbi:MAG: flavodoxin domain-containing protein [Methanobacterium sp.]
MDIITIVVSGILLIFLALIIAAVFIFFDLMSYTARSTKYLTPTGKTRGKALVVYNPGLSGEAKNAANFIVNELKSRDYKVDLAGLRSATAANTSGYDIVIAGGPMYFGKVTKSLEKYLKTVKLPEDVKLGVFATTGSAKFNSEDIASLEKQLKSFLGKNVVTKTLRSGEAGNMDCEDFILDILK